MIRYFKMREMYQQQYLEKNVVFDTYKMQKEKLTIN